MRSKFTNDHSVAIGVLIASIMGALGSVGQVYLDNKMKKESFIYEKQIASLNNVTKNIDTLREFVVDQKEKLKRSQQSLVELKAQQEKLKPVIEADQKTIDAIFALQAEQNKKNIWWERALGFFIGLASSLAASLIWAYTRKKA